MSKVGAGVVGRLNAVKYQRLKQSQTPLQMVRSHFNFCVSKRKGVTVPRVASQLYTKPLTPRGHRPSYSSVAWCWAAPCRFASLVIAQPQDQRKTGISDRHQWFNGERSLLVRSKKVLELHPTVGSRWLAGQGSSQCWGEVTNYKGN